MPERAYTVAEIDRMRHALDHLRIWNIHFQTNEHLRTAISAGVEPDELVVQVKREALERNRYYRTTGAAAIAIKQFLNA
jgi:hypothetical protein